MCFCSWPTCRHGRCGYLSCRLYFCLKYCATVHSMACPFSSCRGNLQEGEFRQISLTDTGKELPVCNTLPVGLTRQAGGHTVRSEGHLRLVTGGPSRHVAHAVLPLHLAAVRHLHFEPCAVNGGEKVYCMSWVCFFSVNVVSTAKATVLEIPWR